MVFLDTNVFVYAAGAPSPWKEACVEVVARVASGRMRGTTSAEVVQEVHHLFRRRGRLADGVALGRHISAVCPDLLPVTALDVRAAGELLLAHPHLSPRDALHVVTARHAGISVIVSTDPDLDGLEGIVRQDPRVIQRAG